jgi:CDP-glucose 4,6-dehydratase
VNNLINRQFWHGKRVFITGHTGFKGTWLCLWLEQLSAIVTGYALEPHTSPSLFELCKENGTITSIIGDVRDRNKLELEMVKANPDIVIHMAAQPLVRESYRFPVETYEINLMGTVHTLEALRKCTNVKAFINVTTDKCYENKEWIWGYRENEQLGGYDPYSNSKACSELITSSYRNSFFNPDEYDKHGVGIATARAGNVIGGGDWAEDRLIPDFIRAISKKEKIRIRNPNAIRPWQHVLEPLSGYLMLAQRLYEFGPEYSESWNFGPEESGCKSVKWIVENFCEQWGVGASYQLELLDTLHEAAYLKLDCSKAKHHLGWYPRWSTETAIAQIVKWHKQINNNHDLVRELCFEQINDFLR